MAGARKSMSISEHRRRSSQVELPRREGVWRICLALGFRRLAPLFLLVLGVVLPQYGLASPVRGLYEVWEIKPGVYVLNPEDVTDPDGDPQFSRRTNAAFIVTSEGSVVVNTMNTPFRARDLLYEIRQVTDLPVRYVINTDAHPDLVLGNEVFMAEKSSIIATTPAAAEMQECGVYIRHPRPRLSIKNCE